MDKSADVSELLAFTSIATLAPFDVPQTSIGYGVCRSVDDFEKLKLCGEGSYGICWKGRDIKSGKEYALKKLRLKPNEEVYVSVVREINALRRVRHPNLVRLVDVAVGKKLHKIFLVMEYCDTDLAYMLNRMNAPFTESQVKCLMLQLIDGLDYLHREQSIVHRDIKLSNLLLNSDGVLKIADFGLARAIGKPATTMTTNVVTLWYRPPELLLGSDYQGTGVDMWACGCILAELLKHNSFLPGESEIDQIHKIIAMFGTPNESIWPGISKLRFPEGFLFVEQPYNNLKRHFAEYGTECLDLLYKLFAYDPQRRTSAAGALEHRYFDVSPLPCGPSMMPTFHTLTRPRNKAAAE